MAVQVVSGVSAVASPAVSEAVAVEMAAAALAGTVVRTAEERAAE